eukprot:m.481156 g.481156  ORF g.481156 m.481156 type:complete len:51 (-) comp55945_c0_seq1:28-180(-)
MNNPPRLGRSVTAFVLAFWPACFYSQTQKNPIQEPDKEADKRHTQRGAAS